MNTRTELFDMTMQTGNLSASSNWGAYSFQLDVGVNLKMRNFTIYILLIFTILSCKQKKVDGIEIGHTLYTNQTLKQNKKLSQLITQTLNKNTNALSELTEFWCGVGAGCYDLGFVCTQLVYKVGETDFINLASKLNEKQKSSLKGLLDVGFEYGNYEDKKTETEFPKLTEILINNPNIEDSTIEEPIQMYNLRKSIIGQQNLDVWPSIVEIKSLSELNKVRIDSLILFIAETDDGDKLRLTNSTDLSKFAEMEYKNDCRQDGTILTDLKLGEINLTEMKAEIFCRKEKYAELKIKN